MSNIIHTDSIATLIGDAADSIAAAEAEPVSPERAETPLESRQTYALESIAESLAILAGLAVNVDTALRDLAESEPASKGPSMMSMLPMLLKAAKG